MQPVAFVILSNLPGENRLKNLKYFLGLGDNVIGCDPRCQIVLPERYEMMHYAANIRAGHNFITIETLHPHLVYVQSNLSRGQRDTQTDNYFPLAQNVQYLPKLGEFFYLGRIKGVVGTASRQELLQLNHIINRDLFRLDKPQIKKEGSNKKQGYRNKNSDKKEQPKKEIPAIQIEHVFENATLLQNDFNYEKDEQNEQYKIQVQGVPVVLSGVLPASGEQIQIDIKPVEDDPIAQSQGEDYEKRSHTEILDHENYQATLLLEEGIFDNEPTINLDLPSQIPPHYSQEQLMQEIKHKKSEQSSLPQQDQEENDFSMPDTIVDQPEQAHNHVAPAISEKQEESSQHIKKQADHYRLVSSKDIEQDDEDEMPPTIKEEDAPPSKIKPSKTMAAVKSLKQNRLYNSQKLPPELQKQEEDKPIEDFMDLFGMNFSSILKHHNSQPPKDPMKDLSVMNISKASSLPLQNCTNSKKKSTEEDMDSNSKDIHVDIIGFKPTEGHRKFLKQQHLVLVVNPHSDYDILLVKQPVKVCNKLLLALLQSKRIESDQWIFNKQAEIQSKVNGLSWKQIYEKKGTHRQPLKGKGRFYVSKRADQLLEGVVQKLGGELVTQLVDNKRVLNLILRTEDSNDAAIFLTNQQNKKWRFLKPDAIVDCVLTTKYSFDQKYLATLPNP